MKKRLMTILLVIAAICFTSCEGLESPKLSLAEPWYYEGEYDDSATYHSKEAYISVVFFDSAYYVAREEAPDDFSGIAPTDRDYWQILSGYRLTKPATNNNEKKGRMP